jgi:hypothetical protein
LVNLPQKGVRKMKKNKGIIKRNIISTNGKTPENFKQAIKENEENPNCTGTAIVYCNRWGCHTHFLCREKNSEERTGKALAVDK